MPYLDNYHVWRNGIVCVVIVGFGGIRPTETPPQSTKLIKSLIISPIKVIVTTLCHNFNWKNIFVVVGWVKTNIINMCFHLETMGMSRELVV